MFIGLPPLRWKRRWRRIKKSYVGSSCCCIADCGADAKFISFRERGLESMFGEVRYARPYYRCAACSRCDFPSDREMGLDAGKTTPATRELIALAGMQFSFPDAKRFLKKASGIEVGESLTRTVTEAAGRRADELERTGKLIDNSQTWDFPTDANGKTIGYIGIDHTGVPQQGANAGKAECRMAAVAMLYNPPADEKKGRPIQDRRYVSGLLSHAEIGERLREHAWQVGFDQVEQKVAIMDAGAGLAEIAKAVFPDVECVNDFYHAAEYVTAVAKALHPHDRPSAEAQRQEWNHMLKTKGAKGLLKVLHDLEAQPNGGALHEALTDAVRYFTNHQDRMDYPRYLKNGWRIGSGPIEAGCKKVVGERLKQTGMRWKEPGSHEICQLRAVFLSGNVLWDRLWDPALA